MTVEQNRRQVRIGVFRLGENGGMSRCFDDLRVEVHGRQTITNPLRRFGDVSVVNTLAADGWNRQQFEQVFFVLVFMRFDIFYVIWIFRRLG